MSRVVRKQLVSTLGMIKEANELLPQLLQTNSAEHVLNLLTDCQESAIAVGTQIDKIYGENLNCVHDLEDYCELLYQIAQKLDDRNVCHSYYEQSMKCLDCVSQDIDQEIPDKLEVVFLPYKVSMWDSLESIWQAAKDDNDCDVYVIPLPFYNRKSDGKVDKLNYEGNSYPDYVPITKWDQYDFPTRLPDIIFIHNPYDNCNYVTSVPPFYYSNNLKQYTEMLVYVPYFVLNEDGLQNRFVLLPGVMNADYVIVQNQQEQQAYISFLKECKPHNNEMELSKKILPLGNPKFDRIQVENNNGKIPINWLQKGKGKKVFLYNTSLSALLHGNDYYIKKMAEVFDFFKKRDDAILLWRPHPLIEETLISMRPDLYQKYQEAKKIFIEEEIGIYDNTPDMYAAIAISDAYYGDYSSMMWLYCETKKPILLQKIDCLMNEKVQLDITDFVEVEDKIYLLANEINSIFVYLKGSEQIKHVGYMDEKIKGTFGSILYYENKLYSASYADAIVTVYNIENAIFETISLQGVLPKNRNRQLSYEKVVLYKSKVFFIGDNIPGILMLNLSQGSAAVIDTWSKVLYDRYGKVVVPNAYYDTCTENNFLWLTLSVENLVMRFNMETEEYEFYHIGSRKIIYNTIAYDGNYFWLSGDKAHRFIIRWNKEKDEVQYFDHFPEDFAIQKGIEDSMLFGASLLNNNKIYFAPICANMIIQIDIITGRIEYVKKVKDNRIIMRMKNLKNKDIYLDEYEGQGYTINTKGIISTTGFCIDNDIQIECSEDRQLNCELYPNFLKHFVDKLSQEDTKNQKSEGNQNGERIYHYLKEKMM